MCGITVCVACPQQLVSNGLTNGLTNGHTNGHINGHVNGSSTSSLREKMQASISMINHRGPDETGIWISDDSKIALGHCRLSINDLSPSGRQPLESDDGQIHAVVNGEIYDCDRLRNLCSKQHNYTFSSESDSELVLALYKIYGAPHFFQHLRGEFAFVICDERGEKRRVIAARDRYGIKPLFWTRSGENILMAAEAKAFLPLGWKARWDVKAIATSGWQLDGRTLFQGVKKLLPGHWIEITEEDGIQIHRYWDAEYEDKRKVETRTIDEMVLGVRERLVESIRLRLRADVPIGVYLSGGIDSSAVAGIVTELARENNVKIGSQESPRLACFSVGFPGSGFDESGIAERTAKFLGLEVIKREVNEDTLARDFSETAYHCEHHHFDLNCVAKFALSTLPREHGFKVVLTGEGADEHFAGYPYFPVEFLREEDYAMPESVLASNPDIRKKLFGSVDTDMRAIFQNLGAAAEGATDDCPAMGEVGETTVPWTLLVWHAKRQLFSPWVRDRVQGLDYRHTVIESYPQDARAKMRSRWHPLHSALYMWNRATLSNVLLSCLGDRTEMAHSIEARTPFLDHHLTEYVNRLPPSVKVSLSRQVLQETNGDEAGAGGRYDQGPLWKKAAPGLTSFSEKWILREAVRPYITDELYQRKKHPFLAPMKWPRDGPLHRMLSELLTRESVEALGFVDYEVVEKSMILAFGDEADTGAFRSLLYVGAWVTLSKKFGIEKVDMNSWTE
ncbi:unnamed protein product [Clonostachys chloroleuca]|uniref:Glutamine amidotransferase type-2 domain-containing protein n=1 Tax=Clonostachys chloroleuca TaxID=1926264 RepID=A0AA35QFJ6_9HYPO|nr:unnamed protein product [Clonostachys chloroleuca]